MIIYYYLLLKFVERTSVRNVWLYDVGRTEVRFTAFVYYVECLVLFKMPGYYCRTSYIGVVHATNNKLTRSKSKPIKIH